MKNTAFNRLRYRLLFLLTFGKTKQHYKKKYKECKKRIVCNSPLFSQAKQAADASNMYFFCQMADHLRLYQKAASLHAETFKGCKNLYAGKDVCLIATGPTLNFFEPVENAVYVGVNKAFRYDKVTLDYLWMQDYAAVAPYIEESLNYRNPDVKRYYGIMPYGLVPDWIIPESVAARHKAKRYYSRVRWPDKGREVLIKKDEFAFDITAEPLTCSGSIVFPAMQFILYTNPKRVYLVGCDSKYTGYFDKTAQTAGDPNFSAVLTGWKLMKGFAKTYYPETEIISVNPVGLKGLFYDVYTESYLNEHPEVDRNIVEILNEGE